MLVAMRQPRLTSWMLWPARPVRWRARLTPLGVASMTTRSMLPISMPSSRDVEHTTARSSPRLRRSSTSRRTSRSREAWWHSMKGSQLGELFAEPVRSGFGAAAGVGEDERGAVLTDEAGEFGNHAHATEAGGRVGIALQGECDAEIDAFGGAETSTTSKGR
jgi:hypothetical protein